MKRLFIFSKVMRRYNPNVARNCLYWDEESTTSD
jgi:hypothetical protein